MDSTLIALDLLSDESLLLVQIARKDRTALAKLYDRYGRASYALAYKILGSVEEAEEAVLDVFSQIWQKIVRSKDVKWKP
jgi:RNA polymerase sigma-70 factor (ECF subfamily)